MSFGGSIESITINKRTYHTNPLVEPKSWRLSLGYPTDWTFNGTLTMTKEQHEQLLELVKD